MKLTEKQRRMVQIITVSAVVLVFIMLVAVIGNLVRLGVLGAKERALAEQIKQNEILINANEQTLEYYSSPEYIERQLREVHNMKKSGAVVYEGE